MNDLKKNIFFHLFRENRHLQSEGKDRAKWFSFQIFIFTTNFCYYEPNCKSRLCFRSLQDHKYENGSIKMNK